jgi:hypothetical protein
MIRDDQCRGDCALHGGIGSPRVLNLPRRDCDSPGGGPESTGRERLIVAGRSRTSDALRGPLSRENGHRQGA